MTTHPRRAPAIMLPWPPWRLPYRSRHIVRNLGYLAHAVPRAFREFFLRGRDGWAPSDTWVFGLHISGVVGAGLLHMADISGGYPLGYPGDDTGWESDLRKHGSALLDHAWCETRGHGDGHTADDCNTAAATAWRWIADNHLGLWD